jgi:hypothetical protein
MRCLGASRFVAYLITGAALAAAGRDAAADAPASPAPPARYDVALRYRILAGGTERLKQYVALVRYLRSIGFVPDPSQDADPRDPGETRLRGTVPGSVDRRLFFRDTHVQALLLQPSGYTLPAELNTPVKVQLELARGLPPSRQRLFADQVRARLARLGFQEAVGYDHRGQTRLLGLIPSGHVPTLLGDLRWQPSGWLAPEEPVTRLPAPLSDISPVQVTEVLPEPQDWPAPKGWGPTPDTVSTEPAQKISPDLRELAAREDAPRQRMEVFLTYAPGPDDLEWRRQLTRAAPGLVIEGRLDTMVTVAAWPRQAPTLARLPIVSGVRLPRPAVPMLRPAGEAPGDDAPRSAAPDRPHAAGGKGQGVRIAVVDGDFRGWDRLREGRPARHVRYVDLTAERSPSLEPDPYPRDEAAVGTGTQAALAAAQAAPEAELVLIRIDPGSPYQIEEAARRLNGEDFLSESVARRSAELQEDARILRQRRADLLEQRRAVLSEFGSDEQTAQRRAEYGQKQADLDRDERAWHERQRWFIDLVQAERDLGGVALVTSSLVWESGYPVSGGGLSRSFTDRPPCRFLWFQSAGNTRGQTWAGPLRDADAAGLLEFAPPDSPLLPARWTRALNFLGWQTPGRPTAPDLPAGLRVRVSVQWQEAHDPTYFQAGEDAYRRPLADLRLVVLRQRDPGGTRVAADEFDVVVRSTELAQRLDNQPAFATYEQVVEFTADPERRYTLQVQGRLPPGDQPADMPTLPAQRLALEVTPRVHVEVMDPAQRLTGRVVFLDYATDLGSLGVPADAQGVFTVGAANGAGRPLTDSCVGPPLGRGLLVKPDALAGEPALPIDAGGPRVQGADLAAPFAAGTSAAALSSGTPPARLERTLRGLRGQVLPPP